MSNFSKLRRGLLKSFFACLAKQESRLFRKDSGRNHRMIYRERLLNFTDVLTTEGG